MMRVDAQPTPSGMYSGLGLQGGPSLVANNVVCTPRSLLFYFTTFGGYDNYILCSFTSHISCMPCFVVSSPSNHNYECDHIELLQLYLCHHTVD